MIQVTDNIWVGDSVDEYYVHVVNVKITAILNVAYDMVRKQQENKIEYMHVGLIDGPGNNIGGYSAAVLALSTLLSRHENVLICCHDGYSRSIAVVILYLILKEGKKSNHPTFLNYWMTWDNVLNSIRIRCKLNVPDPNESHKESVDKIPLALLEQLI